jgi:hypothetical protein
MTSEVNQTLPKAQRLDSIACRAPRTEFERNQSSIFEAVTSARVNGCTNLLCGLYLFS